MTLEEQKSLVQEMVCFVLSHCGLPSKLLCFDDKKSFTKLLASDYSVFFTISRRAFGWVVYVKWPDVSERDRKMGKLGLSPLE